MKANFALARLVVAVLTILLVTTRSIVAEELVVRPQPAAGVYELGQPIEWQVEWKGGEPPAEVHYSILRGGLTEIAQGRLKVVDGRASLKTSLDKPGALLVKFTTTSADGKRHKARGGAVVAPQEIQSSAPRPADFDAFWDAKLKEIAAVRANAKLEQADSGRDGVEYWKITLDGYRGTKIHGQLARPAANEANATKKFPALLIPQWAGVYPLEKPWVTDRAAEGWLVLNILAHDLPIDEPKSFYEKQFEGPLKDYWAIGNDDRETSYFLRMYLSCYQAAKYLTSRPDWNGKTLVVAGGSQGGQQTLVTAAIYPKVTAALAIVPAGCDMLGPNVGRAPGWPNWYDQTHGKDAAKVHEASRYFDVVNFAPRIKCPVLVGFGLIDDVCPAEGVAAAVNEIAASKEVVILPGAEHQEIDGSHQAYYKRMYGAWMPALLQGKSVPPKKN